MTLTHFGVLVSAESYPHDCVKDEGSRKPDQGQDQAPVFFHPSNEPFFDGRTFHSSGFRNNLIESVKPWHDNHIEWLSRTLNQRMKHKLSIQSSKGEINCHGDFLSVIVQKFWMYTTADHTKHCLCFYGKEYAVRPVVKRFKFSEQTAFQSCNMTDFL